MKIAEMEDHHDEFLATEHTIQSMVADREFPAVFSVCEDSFPHIVPALKFRKKREIHPEWPELSSFRIICKYAPPLFEHEVLESLLDFVKTTRLLAKHENGYVESIGAALEAEKVARELWNHLDKVPGSLQQDIGKRLGVSQQTAVTIVDVWEELGVIRRDEENRGGGLHLQSRLDASVEGICPACGVRGKGPKSAFWKRIDCQRCGANGYYHIVDVSTLQK